MAVAIYIPLTTDEEFEKLCKYLAKKCNFKEMPELLWIEGSNKPRVKNEDIWKCDHTLKHTVRWMVDKEIPNIRNNVEKIYDLGGHCDCEVLFNAAPQWKEKRHADIDGPNYMDEGQVEWDERIDDVIYQAWSNIKVKGKHIDIPRWKPEIIWERHHHIEAAVNALKDRHVIVDVEDVEDELKSKGIEISRNYIEAELDVLCPVQRAIEATKVQRK